ncbi:MAG: TIGR01777 family protein, partial [Nitrospirae bacterium]|nr:TIGR01777 family protein [Nitrospirota bacterium]
MNVLITGGSGFIGKALSYNLANTGHNVLITTRKQTDSTSFAKNIKILSWNSLTILSPAFLSDVDAVINLAGEPIAARRWSKKQKRRILSSRIDTTIAVIQSIKNVTQRPKVIISASAIGYYGPREDEYVTEDFPPGNDFLAEVCKLWEAGALKAEGLGVRVVLLRIGAVLESDGGALPKMAFPFKFFLGGHIGSGRQWFSWIHRDDVIGIIKYALENDSISGPINITAPEPVRNKELCSAIGKVLRRPSWLSVPPFIVKLTLGELGDMLLTGQRVIPEKILKAGYRF